MNTSLRHDSKLLTAFKAISNFINDISENFGKNQRNLALYNRLIEKTSIVHTKIIQKHINVFFKYMVINNDAFKKKDFTLLKGNIQYSDKVFVNIKSIFTKATKQERNIIWQHLYTIGAILNPKSEARQLLQQTIKDQKECKNEKNFLNNVINQVEQNITPNANPLQAMGNIMGSGLFQNLIGSMNNGINKGELDINSLMSTVTTMVGSLNKMTDNKEMGPLKPLVKNMNSMVNTLSNTLKQNPQMAKPAQPKTTHIKLSTKNKMKQAEKKAEKKE